MLIALSYPPYCSTVDDAQVLFILLIQAHLASIEYQAFMTAKDTERLLTHLEVDVMEEVKE